MKADLYQQITNQIVRALQQGTRPWHQPWSVDHAAGRIARAHCAQAAFPIS